MENTIQVRLLRSVSSSVHILIGVFIIASAVPDYRFFGMPFIAWGLVQKLLNLGALADSVKK